MRSSVINTTLLDKREYILMKNRREELDIIPNDYILEYYPKKDDVSTLTLEIPSHLRRGELIVEYPLYKNMQPRRHIIVKSDDQLIERYVVEDIDIVDEGDYKTKKVTAYSYDYTLKTKTCLINEGLTRQLYCPADEKVHVGEGILNIFENQTGWKVNHVDDMARSEMVTENVSVTKEILGEKTYETVEDNKVLFELNVDIPAEENFPLNFDIAWVDLVVTTTDGFTYDSGSIIHTFTDLSQGVKSVKATFTSNSTQRYGITYELTLDNDETETHTYAFANCRNLKLATKGVNLTYQTSQEEEKLVVKYRYLEYGQSYWYQYLKTTVQEAFNVYITFNSYDKTINVYSQEQFGKWKGFYLDYNNLLTKVNKQPDMGELCTRLWIQSNNVDITEVNPLGTSYLEDYSYFEQSGTMSISLSEALKRYYAHVEVQQVKWLEVSKLKNSTDQWLTKRNSELVKLNEQVKAKQALLTAYLKANNNEEGQERVAQELKELEAQVSEKLKQIEELKEQSDNYLNQMQLIGKEMAKETCTDSQGKIFTQEDIEELDDLTIEQTYTDEYYTKAKGLFDYAKTIMKDKATLKYTFSLEHKDFAQNIKHPLGWEWFVEIGAKVEIPDKDIADADGFITIYAYKYSPKNKTMESVEFDNNSAVIKAVSGLASFSKIAYNTATMTDFWKETWKEAENATAIVKDIRKNGLDLAANMVRGGNTINKISMTESGLFIIDAENEDNQIYVGSSLIAITDDRWITSKTAIDQGGLIASTVIGKLLLGEQLFISNEEGSFTILPNGLFIKNELGEDRIGIALDEDNNPYFHLGTTKDDNYLIFNPDGSLDIKASSIKLTSGNIPSKDEIDQIVNNALGNITVGVRNYALGTATPVVVEGNGEEVRTIKLYNLSKPGTHFMNKEIALSFDWIATESAKGSFFVRTGEDHYQQLTETIIINSESVQGRVTNTKIVTTGSDFKELELVITNLQGTLRIESLKFEVGNQVTGWHPAPEDGSNAYTITLSNEAHVFSCEADGSFIYDTTAYSQVMAFKGTEEVTPIIDIDSIEVPHGMTIRLLDNLTSSYIVDEKSNNISDEGNSKLVSEGGIWIEFTALSDSSNTEGYYVVDEQFNNIVDETGDILVSEGMINSGKSTLLNLANRRLADAGSVTIPIIIDGITFFKVFTWSKAKKGEQGEGAKNVDIVASSQVFKSENGVTYTPSEITLTPIVQNVNFNKWQYSENGGVRWTDVVSGVNGLVVKDNNLIIANNSPLYTNKITSLVFKLITSDPLIYDTMSISRLADGNLGNVEIGIRNWLSKTGQQKTIMGSGSEVQVEHLYYLVNKDCSPLIGKTITFSCDYEATEGSYGNIYVETNGEFTSPAEMGIITPLSDTVNINMNPKGRLSKSVAITDDILMGFNGIEICLTNVVGEVKISNAMLTIGDVLVSWHPAPEDGTDYTSSLIEELRKTDIQEIINQNQISSDRIDQILSDNIITSSEKVDLLYDFERATLNKESAISYYNTVNDNSMYNLREDMEEAYDYLSQVLDPILEDINSDLEITTGEIKGAFKQFYITYESLMMALQKTINIIVTSHSTKIEQLETEINFTASRTEIMEDKVNQYDAHMKFSVEGFVEIYATQNGQKGAFSTQITDQKLSFKENEVEVAYVSNQELCITKATIENQMQIADFLIKPSGKRGIVFAYLNNQ